MPLEKTVWLSGTAHEVHVPFRLVVLDLAQKGSWGGCAKAVLLYERSAVLRTRASGEPLGASMPEKYARKAGGLTQLGSAKRGIVTPEMEYAAIRESGCESLDELSGDGFHELSDSNLVNTLRPSVKLSPSFVCDEIRGGRAIIPRNVNHPQCEPAVIGRAFLVKINANLGSSSLASGEEEEIRKALSAVRWGADTIMDLSTGGSLKQTREAMLRNSPVPLGTVPIYEALQRVGGCPEELSWPLYRQVFAEQAEQGVDFFTVHAGLRRSHLEYSSKRLCGIVSRGGAAIARWCARHKEENFLYTYFDELCEIARYWDVSLSLGDGLRPGCGYDANDEAQFAELYTLGELTRRARAMDVQVMIEGPGHVPMNLIRENIEREDRVCSQAPFYTLGPLTTDVAAGHDHIASAIGAAMIAWSGGALLCYVTPREHLGLPSLEDVREGIMAYRIAAHAADVARGHPGARLWDEVMSRAREAFSWSDQAALALDPELVGRRVAEMCQADGESGKQFCSMCGPQYCAMALSKRLKPDVV